MNFGQHAEDHASDIVQLFTLVFGEAAGDSEGTLIGKLADSLLRTTPKGDLLNFVAHDNGDVVGSIFLTRINFEDDRNAFILGPVAIRTDRQGQGIGQKLIRFGLDDLTSQGASTVLTYGDPAFYRKVGFSSISPAAVQAPFKLTQPEGWLGQSLSDQPIEELTGAIKCVDALNDPVFW